MNFLADMFSDINGDPSTNRLMSSSVSILPVIFWGYMMIKTGVWIEPTPELITLVSCGLTSKIVQRNIEQKKPTKEMCDDRT